MNNNWSEQFQRKLDGHKKAAPELSWPEVEKALDKNKKQYAGFWSWTVNKPWKNFSRFAAAIAAIVVVGGAGFYFLENSRNQNIISKAQEKKRMIVSKEKETIERAETETQQTNIQSIFGNEVKLFTSNAKDNSVKGEKGNSKETNNREDNNSQEVGNNHEINKKKEEIGNQKNEKKQEGIKVQKTEKKQEEIKEQEEKENTEIYTSPRRKYPYRPDFPEKYGKKKNTEKLIAAVYLNNSAAGEKGGSFSNIQSSPVYAGPYGSAPEEFQYGALNFLANSRPKEVNYSHSHPWKFGIHMSYALNDSWTLSSGVTYSYLHSSFDYSEGKASGTGKQNLHYLGIPLSASYCFLKAGNLRLYATAGGEMEKLIGGKRTLSGSNIPEELESETVKESSLQWSVNGGIGAEYRLSPTLGFYLEPGISHYFNNGSDIENYYKEHSTAFSLNIGMRIVFK